MRTLWAVPVILLLACRAALAVDLSSTRAPKDAPPRAGITAIPPDARDGGDTIESAFPIPALPFADTASTCGFADDYDEACPNPGSAPDVVYTFTPDVAMPVDIDLCSSAYDTRLFVYEGGYTPGAPYACNDDGCITGGYGSRLHGLQLKQGTPYYIVIDGYGSACGQYTLQIDETRPCPTYCPPGSIIEGEPLCHDGYTDQYDNGCCCGDYHFRNLPDLPGSFHVCGMTGNFTDFGADLRDTDWYEVNVLEPIRLDWCGQADFPLELVLIDGRGGCEDYELLDWAAANECGDVCLEDDLEPGRYWLWVAPAVFEGVPCGSTYVLTVNGMAPAGIADGPRRSSGALALSCRPQPVFTQALLAYTLDEAASVRLSVHAADGRWLRTLVDEHQPAGEQTVRWDGLDASGRAVPSGIYFCRLQAGAERTLHPVVVVR